VFERDFFWSRGKRELLKGVHLQNWRKADVLTGSVVQNMTVNCLCGVTRGPGNQHALGSQGL